MFSLLQLASGSETMKLQLRDRSSSVAQPSENDRLTCKDTSEPINMTRMELDPRIIP
jgi:hypothetical protein